MRFVDAHAHLLPAKRLASLLRWVERRQPRHPYPESTPLDHLLREYQELGVELVFNMIYPIFERTTEELNRFNFELARSRAPRILAVGSLHVSDADKLAIVDTCMQTYGFLGLKFHPFIQRFLPWDERLFPVYERMSELRRPVFLHTGFEKFYDAELPIEKLEREILQRFPELPLVFLHALFPHFDEAFRLVESYPHLYLDLANVYGSLVAPPSPGLHGEPQPAAPRRKLERAAERLFQGLEVWHHRVLFGTDHPAGTGTLRQIYASALAMPISEAAKESIFGGAALALVEKYYGASGPAGAGE
ncbi:MAG: amidohydrolase family protein [Candidatus Tectomicrobia bacterium]|nr:amidohydrolase family protein [Candidatus Tectomicrobia bacterium]